MSLGASTRPYISSEICVPVDSSLIVAIFWDYENSPLSSHLTGHAIASSIREIAHNFGCVKLFKAYLDLSQPFPPRSLRSELHSSGVSLTDCPPNGRKDVASNMILVDMLAYAMDNPPPTTFILISWDPAFAYGVSMLRLRQYTVVVVAPLLSISNNSLKQQASKFVDWSHYIAEKNSTLRRDRQCDRPLTATRDISPIQGSGISRPAFSIAMNVKDRLRRNSSSGSGTIGGSVTSGYVKVRASNGSGVGSVEALRARHSKPTDIHVPCLSDTLPYVGFRDVPFLPAVNAIDPAHHGTAPQERVNAIQALRSGPAVIRDPAHGFPVANTLFANTKETTLLNPSSRADLLNSPIDHTSRENPFVDLAEVIHQPSSQIHKNDSNVATSVACNSNFATPRSASTTIRDESEDPRRHAVVSYTPATLIPSSTTFETTASDIVMQAGRTTVPNPEVPTSGQPVVPPPSILNQDTSLGARNSSTSPDKLWTAPTPTSLAESVPHEFAPLVKLLEKEYDQGFSKPLRTKIAIALLHQDRMVYQQAGVTTFKEYTALAERTGAIRLGGKAGEAWISLAKTSPSLRPSSSMDGSESPTVALPSCSRASPGSSANAEILGGPATSAAAPLVNRVPPEFMVLVEILKKAHQDGRSQILRSNVSVSLTLQDPDVYRRVGVKKFKDYCVLAEKAGIIQMGGREAEAWISLSSLFLLPQECAAPHDTPTVESLPANFSFLVELLEKKRLNGDSQPLRSKVGLEIFDHDPMTYKRAGTTTFSEYTAMAERAGIIQLGGISGNAWLSLHPDWHGKLVVSR